jgi:CMP-N,N'-diacetyllegionaminic acid synthase
MAERIAVIPARGGSKGVPGKNKRTVGGRPLIEYSIEAALAAARLDRVLVTTDDPDIADIAARFAVEVVDRPAEIAGDASPVIDAVRHALAAAGVADPGSVVLLQPTSPLRDGADIDAALDLHARHGLAVCSVVRVEDAHPARMYRIGEAGRMTPLMPELAARRRQDLPPLYLRNGALYVFGPRELVAGEIITAPMTAYEMPAERSVNIDGEIDLVMLEAMLRAAR